MGPYPSRLSDPGAWDAPWVVLDDDVTIRTENYRRRLQQIYKNNDFSDIVDGIRNLYVDFDLKSPVMNDDDHRKVMNFLQNAIDNNDVTSLIRAYTSPTPFFRLINTHLANLFNTGDRNQITMANCARRMHYCDGPLDFASILLCHPQLNKYQVTPNERVFRGMTVSPQIKEQYPIGARIVNKTFISASKSIDVAKMFLSKQNDRTSCLFIINLTNHYQRTALSIRDLSTFPEEEEILILPFTAFEVERVEEISDPSMEMNFIIEMKEMV